MPRLQGNRALPEEGAECGRLRTKGKWCVESTFWFCLIRSISLGKGTVSLATMFFWEVANQYA